MTGDQKFWTIFWCVAFSLIATVIVSCTALCNRHEERMAELGYQEESIVGSSIRAWRKIQQPEPAVSNIPLIQCVPASAETLKGTIQTGG